jgi:hypothetical protein
VTSKATNGRLFWEWVETAWAMIPNADRVRAGILSGETVDVEQALLPTIAALALLAEGLTVDGLRVFCSEFDRHMYLLDREELAKHIEYGDDGFMDARATIILLGEAHYRAVTEDFRRARKQVGVEKALYVGMKAWEKRFGTLSYPRFEYSPTTASNPDGWPKVRERQERDARVAAAADDVAKQLGVGRRGLRVAAKDGVSIKLPNLPPEELAAVFRRVAGKLSPKGG